ncbi:plasmid mobilization protein [Enterobacter roggenkampii]|uniref:plasmid mobilization protein n=1 Tax=Enterobacter roggenkampii TaxID=1812935 RepID=UPI002A811BB9|nr:hypothetical protein [Enterobacter roggenkampii]
MKKTITTDLSENQFAQVAAAAKAHGMSLHAYVRKLITQQGIEIAYTPKGETQAHGNIHKQMESNSL